MPRDHAFVRSADPHFGSAFGGACDHREDGTVCGWPEIAHPHLSRVSDEILRPGRKADAAEIEEVER